MITGARSKRELATDLRLVSPAKSERLGSIGKITAANLRASANVAAWRTYLPEDCVAAMIDDGWHWTT